MDIKDNENSINENNTKIEKFENININEEISDLNKNNILFNEQSNYNNIKQNSMINQNNEKITEKNKVKSKKETIINKEMKIREKANKEYEEIVKNNPAQLFSLITEETINIWEKILYKKVENLIKEDCNILNSENTKENYKVVSNDIPRTRFKEKVLVNKFTSLLEYFISYYCMENKIVYKQGLNEIVAPFLLLKYKLPNIPFYKIYNLFSGFINTFATNYFYEKTFYSLKNSLGLLTLLLKYHAPIVQNLFDKIMITPEMYATNWILTTFCGKLKLHLIYYLMNKIILEEDPLIFHFLIIALLIYKKKLFFESDLSMIPVAITTISIDSIEEIDIIFDEAIKIRQNTPYSFRILANLLEIFKIHCEDPKGIYEKYKPDKFLTLPIFPSEIFYICFKGETKCPDKSCRNNTKNKNKNDNEEDNVSNINLKKCEYCDMNIKKDLNSILLDLRILEFEGQEEKTAFLPRVIKIEQKTLKSKYFTDSMIQRFNDDKGKSHLIFMTSKTDFFNEFEENFYIDSSPGDNYYRIPLKTDKEINKDLVNKMSSKDRFKLKEYDNMKKLLITLLENDFPYISFIYGGFEAIHDEISQYNADIYLLNHDKNCEICKSKQQNNSWFSDQISSLIKKSKTFINGIEILKKEDNNSYIKKISSINNNHKRFSETKSKKCYTMEGISQLINNYENFVKYCSLVKYRKNRYDENNSQGVLVMQKYYLLILKMQDNEKAEQIDKIILNFVEKAEIKKKNHLIIDFIDNEKKKFSLEVKFGLEQDAKKFLSEINKVIKQ